MKIKVAEAKGTNAYLERVKFTISTYYQQLQIAGKEVTPQLLKSMFLGEEVEETCSLSKLMDYGLALSSVHSFCQSTSQFNKIQLTIKTSKEVKPQCPVLLYA